MDLSLALNKDKYSHQKLHSAINMASEEFFQCHLNIIRSIDGHIFVVTWSILEKPTKRIYNIRTLQLRA